MYHFVRCPDKIQVLCSCYTGTPLYKMVMFTQVPTICNLCIATPVILRNRGQEIYYSYFGVEYRSDVWLGGIRYYSYE